PPSSTSPLFPRVTRAVVSFHPAPLLSRPFIPRPPRSPLFPYTTLFRSRRDFTVNALYYTIDDFSVHDYTGGLKDLEKRTLRIIGDPATRYKEDPVRMLRAVRFAAKLGFTIEEKTAQPIYELGNLLRNIPEARLFEETLKLFMGGSATATFFLLREYNLLGYLFPGTEMALQAGDEQGAALIEQTMINTDKRIRANKTGTPAFIYAALLWPPLQ